MPRGKKELFHYAHSSLQNVIEFSFGVLKMKWRILLSLPMYPMPKQSQIIMTCMALHNFIRESAVADEDFDKCDCDENYVPKPKVSSSHGNIGNTRDEDEHQNMNQFRDWITDGLFRSWVLLFSCLNNLSLVLLFSRKN
jgi:hypothetical protein